MGDWGKSSRCEARVRDREIEFISESAVPPETLVGFFYFTSQPACGIGGPCRMLAEEFNCEVTGIDLSHEYIKIAQKLSELVGHQDKTKFMQRDALNLPSAFS